MRLQRAFFIACLMCLSATAHEASAAGFYIQEQSAKSQGLSFAGAAANAEDASVIFNNPAAMTELNGRQGVAGLAVIMPSASFTNNGSSAAGNNGGNPFGPTPVPSLYIAQPFAEGTWWAGLAVTAPFGLQNEYNSGWFGRYNSTESLLRTIDIDPSLAVKFADNLSLGGGIDIQHAHAKLDQAVFTGIADDTAEVKGDSWQIGYNLGLLWDVDAQTKLGLHYRSAITQHIDGHLAITGPIPAGALGVPALTPATAKLKLPDVIELGVTHEFSPRLKVMGTLNWFGWRNFNEIRVDTILPDVVVTEDWRNTYALALGAEWKQDEKLTWRGGVQFDETPTGSHRETRVPDSNRFWVSAGGSYAVNNAFSVDGAISHLFMADASVNVTNQFGAGPVLTTAGKTSNQGTILSLQGVLRF